MANVTIRGLEDVRAMIREMDPAKTDKLARQALRKGGEIVRAAIEEAAPVRPALPSSTALPVGALKADIVMEVKSDGKGNAFAFIKPGKYTLHVARWVEYGHASIRGGYSRVITAGRNAGRRRGPGKAIGNVPAHPFIRPAFEATKDEAQALAVREFVRLVVSRARARLKSVA